MKHLGAQSVQLDRTVCVIAGAAVAGKKEGEGPLCERFDEISQDSYFGQKSWEKAESTMLRRCFDLLCKKARLTPAALQYLLSGDLQAQCTGSAFALRDAGVPFFGLYGACSTMGESMSLAAMLIDGGAADLVCAMTGSHFCAAERQFRTPLAYGSQRTPTAQWTATAAGAVLLSGSGTGPRITHITTGKILDAGVTDANNMGAAMAPVSVKLRPYPRHISDPPEAICSPIHFTQISRERRQRNRRFLVSDICRNHSSSLRKYTGRCLHGQEIRFLRPEKRHHHSQRKPA